MDKLKKNYKNIDYYIERVTDEKIDSGNTRTKAYPFENEGLILVNKTEKSFEELKSRIDKCQALGINIPAYIDFKDDNINGGWILEEMAPGQQLGTLLNNNENAENIVASIPYEHIEKYIRDSYLLEKNGIGCEPRRRNIFYDKEKGFTIIDVAVFNSTKNIDSLESVSYFFNMYKNVLNVPFKNDAIKEQVYSRVLKAFETAHPQFEKYKRWIYRGNSEIVEFLKNQGYDLTLNSNESEEYISLINELIDQITEEKINNPNEFGNNKHTNYISLLNNSMKFCHDFVLYNKDEQNLEEYIKTTTYEKLKSLFFENPSNPTLRELYTKVRYEEIDPIHIYDENEVMEFIQNELNKSENNSKRSDNLSIDEDKEHITSKEVIKNALRNSTTDIIKEARNIEMIDQNLKNIKEGETRDG